MTDSLFSYAKIHLNNISNGTEMPTQEVPKHSHQSAIQSDPELAMIGGMLGYIAGRVNTALWRTDSNLRLEVQETDTPPRVNVVFNDLNQPTASRAWNTMSVYRDQSEVTVQPSTAAKSKIYSFRDCDAARMQSDLSGNVVEQVINRLGPDKAPAFVAKLQHTKRASDVSGGPF